MSIWTSRAEREREYAEYVAARLPYLRRVAKAVCGDWAQADDLLQTALIKLYVAWPRIERAGNPDAYVRRIIVRAHIDETRRPWRREHPGLDTSDPRHDRPTKGSPDVETRDELLTALDHLPRMQRTCVVLRHWMGLSVAETAAELDISEGTVKSHTSRGLAALQRYLGEDLSEETAASSSTAVS